MTAANCPSCRAPMVLQAYARQHGPDLEIDLCFACRLIWFDRAESTQLAPRAVRRLFEQLHGHQGDAKGQPLARALRCVRCTDPLTTTHDMVRSNRFQYHRCLQGHGRLIGFWHFLREKQFVRDLAPAERTKLAAQVAQVRCSSCGAAVDVRKEEACSYCRAPLAVLDGEAVRAALAELQQREQPAAAPAADVDAKAMAVLAMARLQSQQDAAARAERVRDWVATAGVAGSAAPLLVDLLVDGLGAVLEGWSA